MLNSYKELKVWQKGMRLVEDVYTLTNKLPKEEKFVLSSQARRSAISFPSNIAEGYKRKGTGDYIRFLSIAEASLSELETQILLMKRLHGINTETIEDDIIELQKMIFTMIKKLSKNLNPSP